MPAGRIARGARPRSRSTAKLFAAAAVIGADGSYSHGITAGRHRKEHAEYIGATARARRRAARIAECEAKIAELDSPGSPSWTSRAQASPTPWPRSPRPRPRCRRPGQIAAAQREHARAAGHLRAARAAAEQAQAGFDESVAACTVTERALRRAAVEHALDPGDVDRVERRDPPVRVRPPRDLAARHREQTRQADAVAEAPRPAATTRPDEESAAAERRARPRSLRHTEEAAKLQALRDSRRRQAQQVLAQVEEAEAGA